MTPGLSWQMIAGLVGLAGVSLGLAWLVSRARWRKMRAEPPPAEAGRGPVRLLRRELRQNVPELADVDQEALFGPLVPRDEVLAHRPPIAGATIIEGPQGEGKSMFASRIIRTWGFFGAGIVSNLWIGSGAVHWADVSTAADYLGLDRSGALPCSTCAEALAVWGVPEPGCCLLPASRPVTPVTVPDHCRRCAEALAVWGVPVPDCGCQRRMRATARQLERLHLLDLLDLLAEQGRCIVIGGEQTVPAWESDDCGPDCPKRCGEHTGEPTLPLTARRDARGRPMRERWRNWEQSWLDLAEILAAQECRKWAERRWYAVLIDEAGVEADNREWQNFPKSCRRACTQVRKYRMALYCTAVLASHCDARLLSVMGWRWEVKMRRPIPFVWWWGGTIVCKAWPPPTEETDLQPDRKPARKELLRLRRGDVQSIDTGNIMGGSLLSEAQRDRDRIEKRAA